MTNKIAKWLLIFGLVLFVQGLTFYLVATRQLKAKLLPDYFQFAHVSDTVYVRDFYKAGEDPPITAFTSHDLKNDTEELKQKLKVNHIIFEKIGQQSTENESDFGLIYHTWVQRGDWVKLSNFFKMKQTEEVIVGQKRSYRREVTYQWVLFFWVKSFEFIESDCLE